MSFLSRFLKGRRAEAAQRPKLDQHSIYTSCQMSAVVMKGKMTVHEPWRRHRKKPKSVLVYLYTNDSSPFLVWYAEKAKKQQPRGCVHTDCCEIVPLDEYSFQIAAKTNAGHATTSYKFHADCWENREEWLYTIREQFRKRPVVPEFQTELDTVPSSSSSSSDTSKAPESFHSRQRKHGHRRTLSADTHSPKLNHCSVLLQRSRSQPHLQNKGRHLRKRPHLSDMNPSTTVQSRLQENAYIRSPEL